MKNHDAWLDQIGWADATAVPLTGDASARRYWRLQRQGQTAILMNDPSGQTGSFANIAQYLEGCGLSAPTVLAHDPVSGLMLLEDFGDHLFAKLATDTPAQEAHLYRAAGQALAEIHRHAPPANLPLASPERLVTMIDLFFEFYVPFAGHEVSEAQRNDIEAALLTALSTHAHATDVIILRDFHAENLIWLEQRQGVKAVGLLDFQDAMIGHRAYDLASLLRDARRDVSDAAFEACLKGYFAQSGLNRDAFEAAFAALSIQRNLRILGIFVRLATEAGKPGYLQFMPRVLRHLKADLEHPAMAAIADTVSDLMLPRQPIGAMLFAAGFGTRMKPLTDDRPKPLIKVGSQTLLGHAFAQTKAAGPLTTVINAHYLSDQIVSAVAETPATVSIETPEILDTGGGLRRAEPLLPPGPVFTLNTDAVWSDPNALEVLRQAWDPDQMKALLLCVPMARAVGRETAGDFSIASDGRLTRGGEFVYTGAQIVTRGGLEACPEGAFSLNMVWNLYAEEGTLFGCVYPGIWCDVGHPGGIALAEGVLKGAHNV